MAIPDNKSSSTPFPAPYIPPDDYDRSLDEDKEAGPVAIGDPSQGQRYQVWHLTYSDPDFTLTPETFGAPVTSPDLPAVAGVTQCSIAFDQNANIAIAYTAGGVASLYWYDTGQGQYTTTPSIAGAISPTLTFDDKRPRQSQLNDILLFYTKLVSTNPDTWVLHYRQQRESYSVERTFVGPAWPYVWKCGMHEALRIQVITSDIAGP